MKKTIVLVLREGGDFMMDDVRLIVRHIRNKWKGTQPRILLLWDRANHYYNLGNYEILPLRNMMPGTWARMDLYAPFMECYRPYLYVDLDTAVISSLEQVFELIQDETKVITLEDFYQKGHMATGLVWFPKGSEKIEKVWKAWEKYRVVGKRMDYFLRKCLQPDLFFQQLTDKIVDFKPQRKPLLSEVPEGTMLVCFHGKPRIPQAAGIIDWVKKYINE